MDESALAVVIRRMLGQPQHQRFHCADRRGFTGAVLAGPAFDLTFKITAGPAEVGQADACRIK